MTLNSGSYPLGHLAATARPRRGEVHLERDEHAALGIQLKDSKDPATGEIVTTWEVKR